MRIRLTHLESGLVNRLRTAKWPVLLGLSKRQERCLTYGETTACNDSWKALFEIMPFSKKSRAPSRTWATIQCRVKVKDLIATYFFIVLFSYALTVWLLPSSVPF